MMIAILGEKRLNRLTFENLKTHILADPKGIKREVQMHGFAMCVFALAMWAVFGCSGSDSGRVLGPASEPAYRPAGAAQANAVIRLSDFTDAPVSGRIRLEVFMVQPSGLVRVSSETAGADATFAAYVPRLPGDGNNDGVVGLGDFFLLADTYGLVEDADNFYSVYDFNGNGAVDLPDFLVFADYFGMSASSGAGKRLAAEPPVSYEDTPRNWNGTMTEELFKQCWEALMGAQHKPIPASKALLLAEKQYVFRFTSLEDPPEFEAFEFGVTGAFPAPGEPAREVVRTDTSPPAFSARFSDGNAAVTISAEDDLASELLVSIISAGDTVVSASAHRSGTSVLYTTGLAYNRITPWHLQAFRVLVSDGASTAVLDTMLVRQDVNMDELGMTDVSLSPEGRLVIAAVTAYDSLSGVPRSSTPITVLVWFPDGTSATGGLSYFSREPDGRVNGSVNSVFGSPNTGEPRNVEVIVRARDTAGNTAEISTTVRQGTNLAPLPPPQPEPDPPPEPEPEPQPNLLEIVGPLSLDIGDVALYHAIAKNADRIEWYVTKNGVRDANPRFIGTTLEFPVNSPGVYTIEAVAINDSGSDVKSDTKQVGPILVLAAN